MKTSMTRMVVSILFLAFLNAILFVFILLRFHSITKGERLKCTTSSCLSVSSNFKKSLDEITDPCYSFYDFVCGGFRKTATFPDHEFYVSPISPINEVMEINLNELLNEPIIDAKDTNYVKLMKKYYKACKNKRLIEENAKENLQSILKELGGWPILEGANWNESTFDWMETLFKAHKLGLPADLFFQIGIKSRKLYIRPGPLNQSYNNEIYLKYMEEMARILGATIDEVTMKEINDTFNFDHEINYIHSDHTLLSKSQEVTLKQLENVTFISWRHYLENLVLPDSIKLTPDLEILYQFEVGKFNYIYYVEELLAKTPKRIQANSILWQIVQWSVPYLNEESYLKQTQFISSGTPGSVMEIRSRWKECVHSITENFKIGSIAIYSNKLLKRNIRPKITNLIQYIRKYIKSQSLKKYSTYKTLIKMLEKADGTKILVGFPDEILNESKIEDYYDGLEFNGENYLNIALNLSSFTRKRELSSYKNTTFDWTELVPAFYFAIVNSRKEIKITPADLYNALYFEESVPEYVKFGFLEEKIKRPYDSFDDDPEFRKYGESCQGELKYYPSSFLLDGTYLSYLNFMKNKAPDQILPGFENFTNSQMFYISYGTSTCIKRRLRFRLDDEAIEHFVNAAASTSTHFAQVFNCPKGSKMSPFEKDICTDSRLPHS